MPRTFRIAVIGSTGKGGYGHGLDTAFQDVPRTTIVAVADDDPNGLKRAGQKLETDRLYADYRRMLEKEKPHIVAIGPRWITDRVAMVTAAAQAGCHIYCEKPFAADLESADTMLAACRQANVKLAIAHQWRAIPPVQQAIRDVRGGKYGRLLRITARPKDDHRGGGEELLVHGTHLFDMMLAFAGMPRWVSAHVTTGGRAVTLKDRREGTEPVGPIAGDSINAMYGFDRGVRGFFVSTANLSKRGQSRFDNLYGLYLECERATLALRQPGDLYVYPAPIVLPDQTQLAWEKQWLQEWHFTAEHKPRPIRKIWIRHGNKTLAADLVDAIQRDRDPLANATHALAITEMVQGTYASHLQNSRQLPLPLGNRVHPLTESGR
ncbi:MAG: Gfo/Idh/MocA family oxidoreductase [Planctomycetaceae bacterium]|jgi:predicted dehydrogenase|nr:Gfo/Idh/MocA family oxidoreductase [Planctomycetaceae bacterium]